MKQYTHELAVTSTGKYLLAVKTESGEFAHYQLYKVNGYWQRKIREVLYHFSGKGRMTVPHKINWDNLPTRDFFGRESSCEASSRKDEQ